MNRHLEIALRESTKTHDEKNHGQNIANKEKNTAMEGKEEVDSVEKSPKLAREYYISQVTEMRRASTGLNLINLQIKERRN